MARRLPPEISLADRMRARILARMHLWGLAPGERLPGVRELARETGADHREVAAAYRELEREGLVEIRGRSGVFASASSHLETRLEVSNLEWLSGVLAEARRRRIGICTLHQMVDRVAGGNQLRCACVESNEDQLVAYSWELREGYNLDVAPVYLPPAPGASDDPDVLREALGGVDLVVTTRFHAAQVCPIAEALGVPVVVLAVDADAARDVSEILRKRLEGGPVTVIVADPLFIRRLKEFADALRGTPHQIRYVLASNRQAVAMLDPQEPVIITRAARDQLGNRTPPIWMVHAPLFAPETVRELCAHITRLRIGA